MKLVEVYRSFSAADANLVCSALQSAGLGARVTHELSTLNLEGYSLAGGGIRVVVPEEEDEDARALIEQSQNNSEPDAPA